MQKQVQDSKTNSPKKPQNKLSKFFKVQHTYSVQYQIVLQLIQILQRLEDKRQQEPIDSNFVNLYNNLSKQIKNTLVFSLLNYKIWNNQNLPVEVRQKTQFFKIVSQWIIKYELKVNDLKNKRTQIEFLYQFFNKQTANIFQRVVLIDEIYEDLIELLGRNFWGLAQIQDQQEQSGQLDQKDEYKQEKNSISTQSTKQQAVQFLKILSFLVQYYSFYQPQQQNSWHNCELYLLKQKRKHYQQFILKSIQYVLSVNSGSRPPNKYLQKHQQMQITRIALIFLQKQYKGPKQIQEAINIIKLLMLRTSKIVRYAMVVDYVRLYDYFEKGTQYEIIEELENMVYFRELIIGHNQIGQAGLINNHLGKSMQVVNVPARSKQRILLSHESRLYGKYSILQFEFLIERDDITVIIYNIKNGKQVQYWKQERSEDRRVDIMLKEEGLYVIEFNNIYSWLRGKKISYKLEQYCNGL